MPVINVSGFGAVAQAANEAQYIAERERA